jgi:hypothetical protein
MGRRHVYEDAAETPVSNGSMASTDGIARGLAANAVAENVRGGARPVGRRVLGALAAFGLSQRSL